MFGRPLATITVMLMTCLGAAHAEQSAPMSLDAPEVLAQALLKPALRGRAVAGVLRDGQMKFAAHAQAVPGEFDPATELFEIGSITKVFTGLLLAQEVERGGLKPGDTLENLLGKTFEFASRDVASITLQQLVTHTSCLPRLPPNMKDAGSKDPYSRYTRTDLHRALALVKLSQSSPCGFAYSNFGMGLLGDLMAMRADKTYEALVIERIAQPLGMVDTVQHLSAVQAARLAPAFSGSAAGKVCEWNFAALAGAGALRSSAKDMLIFAKAMMSGSKGTVPSIATAAKRATQALSQSTPSAHVSGVGYALFISRNAEGRVWNHSGGTGCYRSLIVMHPDKQEAYVLLASNEEAQPGNIMVRLGVPPKASASSADSTSNSLTQTELEAYRGVFAIEGQKAKFTFVPQEGKLYGRLTGQLFNALTPAGKDAFELAEVGARFEFTRDDKGTLQQVTLKQRGNVVPAKRSVETAPANTGPNESQLAEYAGRYALAKDIVFDVQAGPGALMVKLANQPRLPAFATAKAARFEYDVVEAALEFERDANQKITALILHQNGAKQRAARMPR